MRGRPTTGLCGLGELVIERRLRRSHRAESRLAGDRRPSLVIRAPIAIAMASTTRRDGSPGPRSGAQSPFVSFSSRGGVLHMRIAGPSINPREAQIIAAEAHGALRAAGRLRALVLDLSQVKSMSSFGLGMCVDVRNAAHALGARTFVLGLGRELRDLFRMMKVERLFRLVHDDDELRRALR